MNEGKKSKTASGIALLAPVPIRHLESAPDTIKEWGKVAFGSNKFEVFDKLDKERDEDEFVDVYIYASHDDGQFNPEITWLARYIESRERCQSNLRPASTFSDTPFGIYWIVDELRQNKKHLHVAELTAYGKDKPYGTKFVPEGPMLIRHPYNHP